MNDLVEIVWILVVLNILLTILQRLKLTGFSKAKIDKVPVPLLDETKKQLDDGYKLILVKGNSVKLIKVKQHWFPWLFIPIFPYAINIAFNTFFLCNVFGVELSLVDGKVKLSTF